MSTCKLLRYFSLPVKVFIFLSLTDPRLLELLVFDINCLSEPFLQSASFSNTSIRRDVNSEIVLLVLEPESLSAEIRWFEVPGKWDHDCLCKLSSLDENIPELSECWLSSSCEATFPTVTWLKAENADALSGFLEMFLSAILACSLTRLLRR